MFTGRMNRPCGL